MSGVLVDFFAEVFSEHLDPLLDRLQREIVVQPVHVVAIVFDTVLLPESFGYEDSSLFVNRKRDRVRQHRLGSEQASDHALGKLEPFQRPLPLVRRRSDRGFVGRLILSNSRRQKASGQQCQRSGKFKSNHRGNLTVAGFSTLVFGERHGDGRRFLQNESPAAGALRLTKPEHAGGKFEPGIAHSAPRQQTPQPVGGPSRMAGWATPRSL